ncbi:MAG: flagellar filament capping protein FliD, partial [Firmicutes bacterium]|nr:flagellar filament capping protein FliD [Bacillota bacterium]
SLPSGQATFTNALSTNPAAVEQFFGVVQDSGSTAVPTSGLLSSLSTTLSSFVGPSGTMQTDINNVQNQQTSLNSYITQLNSQIASQVQNFQSQLNQLNASLAQSQAQMQEFSSLFGGSGAGAAATINGA